MAKPRYPLDTLALHAGGRARSGDRRPRDADLPDHIGVFRDSDSCGLVSTWSARERLLADLNPDQCGAEERIAALENGVGAIETASGQAARHCG